MTETTEPVAATIDQQQLAQDLVEAARADGGELIGPGGLLTGLTKTMLETALEAEMSEHLGSTSMIRPGPIGGTRATAAGPRRCSARSARSRSRCPGIGTARSTR